MQGFEEDYYAILGVDEAAPPGEIRKAYLRLAKKLHPDRFPNDPEQRALAHTEFAKVTRAHDVVCDAQRRAEYDALRSLSKKRAQAPGGDQAVAEDHSVEEQTTTSREAALFRANPQLGKTRISMLNGRTST